MENVSLTDIKSYNKQAIIELYQRLNFTYPPEADLEYLRSRLRLIKLGAVEGTPTDTVNAEQATVYEPFNFYDNQEIVTHELLRNNTLEHTYEDVDDHLTYANLGSTQNQAQHYETGDTVKMAEKSHCFTPQNFAGKPSENAKSFLSHYERVATANSWDNKRKLQILPLYVTDTALVVLENLEREHGNDLTWEIVKKAFLKTFSFTTSTEVLEMQLNARVQTQIESPVQYMSDVVRLCSLIDDKMAESRVCGHILKGMNPAILQQIAMWDNSTKEKLLENISKYEKSSLLLRHRLGADVIATPIQKSATDDLKSEIDTLKHAINQLRLEKGQIRKRSGSGGSHYSRELSREREGDVSYSRDFRGRDRSTSRGRDDYTSNERRPRASDHLMGGFSSSFSRTPTKVKFSGGYSGRESRGSGPHASVERRSMSPYPNTDYRNTPSQPCRYCGKPHWSQDCRYRNSKN